MKQNPINLEKLNHFAKFNLETVFSIDEKELETAYLQQQRKFHPDKNQNQNNQDYNQNQAEINSILINQAYQILKNPIKRAIYLLQLQNINIEDETNKTNPSKEVLMLIMELREEILEHKDNSEKIAHIQASIKALIKEEMAEISQLFLQNNFTSITQKLIKVKYLDKILLDLKTFN